MEIIKSTTWLLSGNIISSIFGVIFVIFAARFLGPSEWGIVAAVTGFIPILMSVTDLGVNAALFQYAASRWIKDEAAAFKAYRTAFLIRILTLGAAFAVLLGLAKYISLLIFGLDEILLTVFSGIGLIVISLFDFQVFALQSKQSWKVAAALTSLVNILRVFLLLFLWKQNLITVSSVLIAYIGSALFLFIISLFWLRGLPRFEFGSKKLAQSLASFSLWMAGNKMISTVSSRIDVLILISTLGSFETGIYAAANRLALGVPLVAGSFSTVLAARFASLKTASQARAFFLKSVGLSAIFAVGILVGVFLAPFIVSFLGNEYQRSLPVLRWLLLAIIPLAMSTPAVVALTYYLKKPKIITSMAVLQLIIVVLINYLFIPSLGIWAAVWAVGISQLSTTIITYFFAIRYLYRQ
jgi:O-antigen/teichoic acid export membrane protein